MVLKYGDTKENQKCIKGVVKFSFSYSYIDANSKNYELYVVNQIVL
jgi:hypothetical protein